MNRLKSALKNAVAFFVVGPVIGVLIYTVWGWTLTSGQDWSAWLGILWLLPFGYLLGGLPAAITGFLAGLVVQPGRPYLYLATSGVVGALVAASIAWLDSTAPSSMDGVANLTLIGALASVGTAGVRLLFNLLRSRRAGT
jgi:hypothetical protein